MGTAKIYTKGQVTIPRAVREAAGLAIGDPVIVEAREGEVVVRRPRGVLEFDPPERGGRDPLPWPDALRAARAERTGRRTPPAKR
ncbi:MAG: AbrB/MazE/SpoVT family DNA-binding domain-containing protein [Thermoleophilaceae bacterium]|jgi:AbrB family looped-hinge helix DNA binding protein